MKRPLTVSIVIPNWNGRNLLKKNLPSVITAAKSVKNNIIEIIIVDDGSTDDSVEFLKESFKNDIRIVQHEKNRGFSAAVNAGIKTAKGPLVCLLNTDVIPSKNFLEKVVPHFKNTNVFAVGLHEKGYGPSTAQFVEGYFKHQAGREYDQSHISMWASGGSAVFNRDLWWKLHGLDEELLSPFYWEDVEIGYRAWKHGYTILWEPSAHVIHAHESVINSTNFQKKYISLIKERNELLFIWKNIHSKQLLYKHKLTLLNRSIKHPGYLRVIWMALNKRSIVLRKRDREKRESTVSDEAVFGLFKT